MTDTVCYSGPADQIRIFAVDTVTYRSNIFFLVQQLSVRFEETDNEFEVVFACRLFTSGVRRCFYGASVDLTCQSVERSAHDVVHLVIRLQRLGQDSKARDKNASRLVLNVTLRAFVCYTSSIADPVDAL